jgi:hypothetical protein
LKKLRKEFIPLAIIFYTNISKDSIKEIKKFLKNEYDCYNNISNLKSCPSYDKKNNYIDYYLKLKSEYNLLAADCSKDDYEN